MSDLAHHSGHISSALGKPCRTQPIGAPRHTTPRHVQCPVGDLDPSRALGTRASLQHPLTSCRSSSSRPMARLLTDIANTLDQPGAAEERNALHGALT